MNLRQAAMRFHNWSSAPIEVPRSLCLLILVFVVTLTVGAVTRSTIPKPVQRCPDGSAVYPPIRYL